MWMGGDAQARSFTGRTFHVCVHTRAVKPISKYQTQQAGVRGKHGFKFPNHTVVSFVLPPPSSRAVNQPPCRSNFQPAPRPFPYSIRPIFSSTLISKYFRLLYFGCDLPGTAAAGLMMVTWRQKINRSVRSHSNQSAIPSCKHITSTSP